MKDPTNKIDIVHPNKGREGSAPTVITIHVQEGTNYLPDFFKQSGDDSTMWCKQDGTLIRMEQDSDSAWTNGRMTEPIDHANPVIQGLYNQGVRNSNNYALTIENQGFASQGFTDAQVEANAKMCAYWMLKYGWTDVDSRIVGHFQIGEHKLCPGSKYPWARLRARVSELIGGTDKVTNEKPSQPAVNTFPTGKIMGGGFKIFYDKLKAGGLELLTFGYPITNEFDLQLDGKNRTVQLGQRAGFIFEPENTAPWDIHFMTTDQLVQALEVAKSRALLN